jgi:hypothetical protein
LLVHDVFKLNHNCQFIGILQARQIAYPHGQGITTREQQMSVNGLTPSVIKRMCFVECLGVVRAIGEEWGVVYVMRERDWGVGLRVEWMVSKVSSGGRNRRE